MTFNPRRFKSIDILRGTCMAWMFLGHLLDWWLQPEFFLIRNWAHVLLDSVGASGFLFISGVSLSISYKNQLYRVRESNTLSHKKMRNTYFLRSTLLLLIALIYNLSIAMAKADLSWVWSWYILMTTAFSMIIMWPLFKVEPIFRFAIAILLWFLGTLTFQILLPYKGNSELLGILYHFLYNPDDQDPFIIFFSFFLLGTIFGESLSHLNFERDSQKLRKYFNKSIYKPFILIGPILIILGILLSFPGFLTRSSLSWLIYSSGILLTYIVILLYFEENGYFNTKKSYRLLFYYSYYSLTVYLSHNVLFFVCINCLSPLGTLVAISTTFILFGRILNQIYKLWGWKASIKAIIGRLSVDLANKIENKSKASPLFLN